MTRLANFVAKMLVLVLMCASVPVQASGLLELGSKPAKETIVPIGKTPEKRSISLDLGSLRTREAQLPPAPLTRSERMMLRAKRAMSRQQAVTDARRQRISHQPNRRTDQEVEYDETEGFPIDSNGDPVME